MCDTSYKTTAFLVHLSMLILTARELILLSELLDRTLITSNTNVTATLIILSFFVHDSSATHTHCFPNGAHLHILCLVASFILSLKTITTLALGSSWHPTSS